MGSGIPDYLTPEILVAAFFIVPGLGDGPRRATTDALSTEAFREKKAIGVVIIIRSLCWGDLDKTHH